MTTPAAAIDLGRITPRATVAGAVSSLGAVKLPRPKVMSPKFRSFIARNASLARERSGATVAAFAKFTARAERYWTPERSAIYADLMDALKRQDLRALLLGHLTTEEAIVRWRESLAARARLRQAAEFTARLAARAAARLRESVVRGLGQDPRQRLNRAAGRQSARRVPRPDRQPDRAPSLCLLAVETLVAAPHGPTLPGAMPAAA